MEFATNPTDGIRIAYRAWGMDAGTSAPIVLVHGTALSQAIWRGFGYVRDLAPDFTTVTIDLRGHGRSDKPHEPSAYAMNLLVSDIVTVLDALNIDRAHYLGYSLGARIGFSLAAAHPERMLDFISIAGAPKGGRGAFDRVFFPNCIRTLETAGMSGFLSAWEEHSGAAIDVTTRAAFGANDALALAAYMRESEADPGVDDHQLRHISTPTLQLVGSQDDERMRAAEHAAQLMPATSVRVLDGATHADTPRHPKALSAVRAFLTR